ncbi:MAG: hypothetical protein H7288_10340 [Kineosporiaceae bacterium]|nr:hypothetical protein [Aeromicrobium sp.]
MDWDDDPAPRKPGALVYDKGLLVALVPFLLAGFAITWWFMTGATTTGDFVFVFVLIIVGLVVPAAVLWAALEDATRGFTRGHSAQLIVFLWAPPLLVVAVVALGVVLSFLSLPQAMWAGGLVLFASLPTAVFGAVKVLQTRKLPYQDPRGGA